ncbi:MAG TPA: benzoate-CoA ligase family protein [Gemmatimonadaceae bacterium]|nr:benzoate-CoA ligase family protein [Gemmatimonadaceae bacterium]
MPRSAHLDTFARDHLPPVEMWPPMDYSVRPELGYPEQLNCAAELLDRHVAEGRGDRIAIRSPAATWSYRELMERSNRIARVLVEELGVVPGNRVLLRGANSPMLAACWFAVLKAGAICVATMPLLRARELSYIMDKAQIRLALTDAAVAAELEQAGAQARVLERTVHYGTDAADGLEALMARKPATFDVVRTASDDVAIIAFTSGTTGQAKGTMHFHRDVLAICDLFPRSTLRAGPDDLFCGSPPLAFTFGLGGLLLFPMRIGASTLLLEQATPPNLIQGIQDFRATVCFTAPTAYRTMAGMAKDFDLSSLRKCVSAGEHLPLATFRKWEEATGIRIIDGIGSTEMLHIFISAPEEQLRPGSTGRTVPGYEARIIDDDGQPLPPGAIGHLAVRGPTGCRYLDNVERQAAYVKHGWNLPGDSYRLDEDGYFWYQARTDDLIVSSGYKISGPEVENALLDHPCVLECGVVGVPDEERGHLVKAFIVLREGFDAGDARVKELQEWVKAQIAPYKYPRAIEFVRSLPKTETGKLQRFRLRAESPRSA